MNWKFRFSGKGKLVIGREANLWSHGEVNSFATFHPGAVIQIGARTRVNGVTIQSKVRVKIGDDCLVGSCMLIDTDFHSLDPDRRNDPSLVKSAPIVVGNKVWLAGQSAVLKGVTIGDGATVGFRAVVAGGNVDAGSVMVGNPAVRKN